MISAPRTLKSKPRLVSGGFTLLEIILAITIALILLGMSTVLFRSWKSQKALEEAMAGIESCARTAQAGVLQDRRPWMVVFTKTQCGAYNIGGLPPEGTDPPPPAEAFEMPDELTLFLKRSTWPDWKEIVIPEFWRFEPRAMLEPIEVRLESPKGWIQGRFDPLTARLTDMEMEAK